MPEPKVPVFIFSVERQLAYLAGNGLRGEFLDLDVSNDVRRRLISEFARIYGVSEDSLSFGSNLKTGEKSYEFTEEHMWDGLADEYEDDVPTQVRAAIGERLVIVFEDRNLLAVQLEQDFIVTADMSDADIYVCSYPSVEWIYVRTHEPYGPYFVTRSTDTGQPPTRKVNP